MGLEGRGKSLRGAPGSITIEASVELEEVQVGLHVPADSISYEGAILVPALVRFALNLNLPELFHGALLQLGFSSFYTIPERRKKGLEKLEEVP